MKYLSTYVVAIVLAALGAMACPVVASVPVGFDLTFIDGGNQKDMHFSAWVPDTPIRGMLILPPAFGGDSRYVVSHPYAQALGMATGLGIIGAEDNGQGPGDSWGSLSSATENIDNIQHLLDTTGTLFSRPEISNSPLAFMGFSKGGWLSSKFASYVPERTIGFVADKSGTWIRSISDQARCVPGIFIYGQYDGTVSPSYVYTDGYNPWRSVGGEVALGVDWGAGHQEDNSALAEAFLGQCLNTRYPAGQLPSIVPGNPPQLNTVPVTDGWLVEPPPVVPSGSAAAWPEIAPYGSYSKAIDQACWVPTEAMAMVLRAHNSSKQTNGLPQIKIVSVPGSDPYAYQVGQPIDLQMVDLAGIAADVTDVQVFHENQLIWESSMLPGSGVFPAYTPTANGIHTFITVVTYAQDGQNAYASDFTTAIVVPEPATATLLTLCGMAMLVHFRSKNIMHTYTRLS